MLVDPDRGTTEKGMEFGENKNNFERTNYWTSENVPGIVNITNSNMLFLKEWISYGICPLLSGLFHLA